MKKAVSVALAAALSLGIIGGVGLTALADTSYTVKKGDCLWNIAKEYLGDGAKYKEIFDANKDKISNPDKIFVGQVIVIPDGRTAEAVTEDIVEDTTDITDNNADQDTNDGFIPGVVNPITTCTSLDEMNELAGTMVQKPGVMGVQDEKFLVINAGEHKIAEYSYTVNGQKFVLRHCNNALEDISGVYVNGKTAFQDRDPANGIDYVTTDDMKLARWFRVEGEFILIAEDAADMTQEQFEAIAQETLETNALQTEN